MAKTKRKKKIGIAEFVTNNYQLFTVFSVFLALTSYLKTTNDTTLLGISFIISILIGFSILSRTPEEGASSTLIIFIFGLIGILFSIINFVVSTFSDLISLIIFLIIIVLTIIILKELKDWIDKHRWAKNRVFYIISILIIGFLIYVLFSYFKTLSDVPFYVKLTELKWENPSVIKSIVIGTLLILLWSFFFYLRKLDKQHRIFEK